VATSIAAFIGWAPQGPTSEAQLVLSFADYARLFGGLDSRSLLGYAVSQFFGNGGSQAYIIRLADTTAVAATTSLTATGGALNITAWSSGAWGNNYGILIKRQIVGGTATGRFRLQVVAVAGTQQTVVESFDNLSLVNPIPRGASSRTF